MKRDAKLTAELDDVVRLAAGLPVGEEGEYFVGSLANYGQDRTPDVVDYNQPPAEQPGLWCQWIPIDPHSLAWDEGEKFYEYVHWLEYLIEHFMKRWGYVLNGEVEWEGESRDDRGRIIVTDNRIAIQYPKIVWESSPYWISKP